MDSNQDRFEPLLAGFGQMYTNGNAYTENLNKMGGEGTAQFKPR